MADVLRLAVALAYLAGQASAIAAPTSPPVRTAALRLWHDATPGKLSLTVEARVSGRDEANFIAVFNMWRVNSKSPRLTKATVMDIGPDNARLCPDPNCTVTVRDGRFRYQLTVETLVEETYYVVVRGVDPSIKISGAGWRTRADLAVQHYDATNSSGSSRTYAAFGRAYEQFAGTPVTKPMRESVAYAALPCEDSGQGSASLTALPHVTATLSCADDLSASGYMSRKTQWQLSGTASGLTNSYVRLLVVGRT